MKIQAMGTVTWARVIWKGKKKTQLRKMPTQDWSVGKLVEDFPDWGEPNPQGAPLGWSP